MTEAARAAEVMLVAGEASGDLHAANLVKALRALRPNTRCYGMGGGRMRAAGVEILIDSSRLAVVGIVEVLAHYREIRAALRSLQETISTRAPDLLILIDYPEFNLRLAATAKRAGVKVLYYVSPQVWAWRPGRVKQIGRLVDMMAVVFAFEVPFYEKTDVPVRFVGHPLVDEARPSMSRPEALEHFGLQPHGRVIGLFPGSRRSEITRLMPILVDSTRLLHARFPDAQFLLPVAPGLERAAIERYLEPRPSIELVEGANIYDVIQVCHAIVTASGTATLQIALLSTPMVIIYKVSMVSYWVAKHLITLNHIGLINIVAGRSLVPELIQHKARPWAIARQIERLLTDQTYADKMRREMADIHAALGEGGGSRKVALLAIEMLQEGG